MAVKPVSRYLRVFLLAWSLLLATQTALVHGYTHQQLAGSQTAGNASRGGGEPEKAQHEQLCTLCLSLSQFGSALPSHHHLVVAAFTTPDFLALPASSVPASPVAARHARGPPVLS
jgi:hypothetical protein